MPWEILSIWILTFYTKSGFHMYVSKVIRIRFVLICITTLCYWFETGAAFWTITNIDSHTRFPALHASRTYSSLRKRVATWAENPARAIMGLFRGGIMKTIFKMSNLKAVRDVETLTERDVLAGCSSSPRKAGGLHCETIVDMGSLSWGKNYWEKTQLIQK